MSTSEFTLVNHDSSMAKLRASMERVGVAMTPELFVRTISNVYHEVEAQRHSIDMHAYFRRSGGYEVFKQVLTAAKRTIKGPVAILNIGCGAGYDLEVLSEVFPHDAVRKVVCCDISADMQSLARVRSNGYHCRFVLGHAREAMVYGPYDLIVTHAMIHHVADLKSFFETIDEGVVPGGALVTGHEPNHRFWTNSECQAVLQRLRSSLSRRKKLAKYTDPYRYVFKVARMLGMADDVSLEARINRILRERYEFKSELSAQEIRRLVDVHVPDAFPGDFKIGLDGFDWEALQKEFLPKFELGSVGTSGYLGETCTPADLPKRWQQINQHLAQKYPLDGSNFSAFWHKREDQ